MIVYNVLIEVVNLMKLIRLMNMYLNETYSRVRVGKNLSDISSSKNGLKQRKCFKAIDFLLSFRECHQEGSDKSGWIEIKWYTSASGLC